MKPTTSTAHSRSAGFTLVELLVTITIILVLAGITFVVAKRVRQSADMATAVQRVGALARANSVYAADHNGKYVAAYSFDEDAVPGIPWHYNPDFIEALINDWLSVEDAEEYEGVDGIPEQLLDPVVVRAKKRYWSRLSASFGYNNENMPGGGWGQPGTSRSHTLTSMTTPSESFAFITATDWIVNYGGRFLWRKSPVEGKTADSKIAYRHRDKAAVAFYDGHAATISIYEVRDIDRKGGINHVFWGGQRRSR